MGKFYQITTRAISGAIGLFSPARAIRYQYTRGMLEKFAKRGYAAGRMRGPDQGWTPQNLSADVELRIDASRVLARSRDLVRNDEYVAGAFRTWAANVVGTGIVPQANASRADGSPDDEFNAAAEKLFGLWAKAEKYYQKQKLIAKHLFQDGELLLLPYFKDHGRGLPPIGIQLVECDQLSNFLDGQPVAGGGIIRRGVEVNMQGEAVAYYVLDYHPGDLYNYNSNYQYRRIPAGEVLHIFDQDRISQGRGIPLVTPIIMRAYARSEYQNTEMTGARVAAAMTVFKKREIPDYESASPVVGARTALNNSTALEYLEAGRIETLAPGESIEIASHNRPGNTYEPFMAANLRGEAMGLGMTYESYSGDYTSATFSSARAAASEERRRYKTVQELIIEDSCNPIWNRFVRDSVALGLLKAPGFLSDPERYLSVIQVPPGWDWAGNPVQEVAAAENEIAIGTNTRTRISAAKGRDFEENLRQLAREQALADELGIDISPSARRETLTAPAPEDATNPGEPMPEKTPKELKADMKKKGTT